MYRKSGGGGGVAQTRPAAMHVDEYQAAEEDHFRHERNKNYSPSDQYDASNHSPRYRSPPYRHSAFLINPKKKGDSLEKKITLLPTRFPLFFLLCEDVHVLM